MPLSPTGSSSSQGTPGSFSGDFPPPPPGSPVEEVPAQVDTGADSLSLEERLALAGGIRRYSIERSGPTLLKVVTLSGPHGIDISCAYGPNLPASGFTVAIELGSDDDPDALLGVSRLAFHCICLALNLSSENSRFSSRHMTFTLRCPSEDLSAILSEVATLLRDPFGNEMRVARATHQLAAEMEGRLESDEERLQLCLKQFINQAHPGRRTATSVSELTSAACGEWWRNTIGSDRLHLAICMGGQRHNVNRLEKHLATYFDGFVPGAPRALPTASLLEPDWSANLMHLTPHTTHRAMDLFWEVRTPLPKRLTAFLTDLRGESFAALAHREGLLLSACIEQEYRGNDQYLVRLALELTYDGTQRLNEVMMLWYATLSRVKEHGLPEGWEEEWDMMEEVRREHPQPIDPAAASHELAMKQILPQREDSLLSLTISALSPYGAYAFVRTPEGEEYGYFARKLRADCPVPYLKLPIGGPELQDYCEGPPEEMDSPYHRELWSREWEEVEVSPLVPINLEVRQNWSPHTPPRLVHEDYRTRIVHLRDSTILTPESYFDLIFYLPHAADSHQQTVLRLWRHAFLSDHAVYLQGLKSCGTEVELRCDQRGIRLVVSGFSQFGDRLVDELMTKMREYRPTETSYLAARTALREAAEDMRLLSTKERLYRAFKSRCTGLAWDPSTVIDSVGATNWEEGNAFAENLFHRQTIHAFAFGNCDKNELERLFSAIQAHQSGTYQCPAYQRRKASSLKNLLNGPTTSHHIRKGEGNALLYPIAVNSGTAEARAYMLHKAHQIRLVANGRCDVHMEKVGQEYVVLLYLEDAELAPEALIERVGQILADAEEIDVDPRVNVMEPWTRTMRSAGEHWATMMHEHEGDYNRAARLREALDQIRAHGELPPFQNELDLLFIAEGE